MLMGMLIGMIQNNETGGKGGQLEEGGQKGWGLKHKGRGWLLHRSTDTTSVANVRRQSKGKNTAKWADVVEAEILTA